jgi:hypothetical protein
MNIGKYKIESNQYCFTLKEPRISKDGKPYDSTVGFYTSFNAIANRICTDELKVQLQVSQSFEYLIAKTSERIELLFNFKQKIDSDANC